MCKLALDSGVYTSLLILTGFPEETANWLVTAVTWHRGFQGCQLTHMLRTAGGRDTPHSFGLHSASIHCSSCNAPCSVTPSASIHCSSCSAPCSVTPPAKRDFCMHFAAVQSILNSPVAERYSTSKYTCTGVLSSNSVCGTGMFSLQASQCVMLSS